VEAIDGRKGDVKRALPGPNAESQARRAGTQIGGLQGCRKGVRARQVRATDPEFAIAISGGGFRASLAALGVLRFFASAGLLTNVRTVSSVSGGSVTNALFALSYPTIALQGFTLEAFDAVVTTPLLSRVTGKSLTRKLIANSWRAIGPRTRTDVLAKALDHWFFHGATLSQITTDCDFVFNATNLHTSVRFGFQQYRVGDYVIGFTAPNPKLRVAQAVAASAAVPGVFAPVVLRGHEYPCDPGYPPRLVDGGVYDNLGIEPLNRLRSAYSVVMNAGGVFRVGKFGRLPIVGTLSRSSSTMYRQTTALRMRALVDSFQAWETAMSAGDVPPPTARRGVVFALATSFTQVSPAWRSPSRPEDPDPIHLQDLPTSFSRFKWEDAIRLINRGWWLVGASLSTYHPDLLHALPALPPIPTGTS